MTKIKKRLLLLLITAFTLVSCTSVKKPDTTGVVGIAWRSDTDSEFYTNITKTLDDLGIPYAMVDQVVDHSLLYENGSIADLCTDENDILLTEYAESVKKELYADSNAEEVMTFLS